MNLHKHAYNGNISALQDEIKRNPSHVNELYIYNGAYNDVEYSVSIVFLISKLLLLLLLLQFRF